MHEINLFNHTIKLRDYHCSLNSEKGIKITKPYVNMYVKLNNTCNARCKFCKFTSTSIKNNFNFDKYIEIFKEIRKTVKINKISFTGGEPTLNLKLLNKCLNFVKSNDKNIFTVVNTNGLHLKILDFFVTINSIALSRHHYNDQINNKILNFKTPSKNDIKMFKNKNNLHLSCNLIKGYIDSENEVLKYLDEVSKLEVNDVGFVSLMKINNYCREHHIDFNLLNFNNKKDIYINKEWQNKNYCRCRNYLFMSQSTGNIVKVYSRYYSNSHNPESILVFDGQHLREGFNGKIIY
ncbi:MAG: radical SAM protein [archaeon]